MPTVSVIIPHYNDLVGLDKCLNALQRQTYPSELVEVVVADNASPQGLESVERVAAGRAKVISVEERGAGPARNGAVAHATGEVLAFTDSDCVPEPQWLVEGVRGLDTYDFVGGSVTVLVEDEEHVTPPEAFERVFAFDFKTYIQVKGFTGSGNLFCAKPLFESVGGFRVGVSEDYEWSKRAQSHGHRLGYAPNAVVGHPARRTWAELTRKWKRLNVETYGLSEGQPLRRVKWLFRTLLLPASAVVHTPKVLFSPRLKTLSQRIDGLCVLYAIRFWRLQDALKLLLRGGAAA
ncbi:glycosyltransferase [uncultured Phenylobacterium sp.]|uniref:glycosyltransferase n=1 Tax=uncultured Phenylobacterium sp. TaxID=349273 RepID=UPI0025F08365|nr:glycosyltransferase [uncultured Phenylobacterium sp.]